jgi:hypothetical protein
MSQLAPVNKRPAMCIIVVVDAEDPGRVEMDSFEIASSRKRHKNLLHSSYL